CEVFRIHLNLRLGDYISGTHKTIFRNDSNSALPHTHHVVGDISFMSDFVQSFVFDETLRPTIFVKFITLCDATRDRYNENRPFWLASLFSFPKYALNTSHLPVFRHVAQPLHAGGFETNVGVEAAGDGAVDDRLLLLLQQLDQLLLRADVPPNPPVLVVEKTDDGGLFGEGWDEKRNLTHSRLRQVPLSYSDAVRCPREKRDVSPRANSCVEVLTGDAREIEYKIRRTDDSVKTRDPV